MTTMDALEFHVLWADFRATVNMTTHELAAWLRTGRADDTRWAGQGHELLELLGKPRTDFTDSDIELMCEVVETVQSERDAGPRSAVPEPDWRSRLMTLGHNPLRS